MEGVAHVVGCRLWFQIRPEPVHQFFAVEGMVGRQGQKLDQRLRLAKAPGSVIDDVIADSNAEATEQRDAEQWSARLWPANGLQVERSTRYRVALLRRCHRCVDSLNGRRYSDATPSVRPASRMSTAAMRVMHRLDASAVCVLGETDQPFSQAD